MENTLVWIRGVLLNYPIWLIIIELLIDLWIQFLPFAAVIFERKRKVTACVSKWLKRLSWITVIIFGLLYLPASLCLGAALYVLLLPVFNDESRSYWAKHFRNFCILRIVLFAVSVYAGHLLMLIILLFWGWNNGNTIWCPYYNLLDIAAEISLNDQLPHSEQELLEVSPKMREIAYYGRWCYFYEPEKNDFYLVAEYAGLWFVLTREGELDRSFDIDSRASQGQFVRCAAEKWW